MGALDCAEGATPQAILGKRPSSDRPTESVRAIVPGSYASDQANIAARHSNRSPSAPRHPSTPRHTAGHRRCAAEVADSVRPPLARGMAPARLCAPPPASRRSAAHQWCSSGTAGAIIDALNRHCLPNLTPAITDEAEPWGRAERLAPAGAPPIRGVPAWFGERPRCFLIAAGRDRAVYRRPGLSLRLDLPRPSFEFGESQSVQNAQHGRCANSPECDEDGELGQVSSPARSEAMRTSGASEAIGADGLRDRWCGHVIGLRY